MTNVYIPFHLLTNVRVKVLKEGQWIKGEYVEEEPVKKIIKAVYMPLSLNELKNILKGL